MNSLLLLCFVLSFAVTCLLTPYWMKIAAKANLVGTDMHKKNKLKIPEIGGIAVIAGFLAGILSYIAIKTFYFKEQSLILPIMAVVSTILLATIIGLIDDILGWKIGLKQWQKPLLMIIAALPFMVANFGHSTMHIPFVGAVEFGIIYPLVIIPVAIVGASNAFNMIGGYNGLEAGMGMIILFTLGIINFLTMNRWIAMISFSMFFALLAFYYYNRFPAKIFPGNTLTYAVGALIACIAILGNNERAALILFVPYFIEFVLKSRGKFRKESFAKLNKDSTLGLKDGKVYGMEHLVIYLFDKLKKPATEKKVVRALFLIEAIFALIVLIPFLV